MRKFRVAPVAILTFAALAAAEDPSLAKESCSGREYPAKAIAAYAGSAKVEVDLGFGLTYRVVVKLNGTKEPDKPSAEWNGKASEALGAKIYGKPIRLCIVGDYGPNFAILFVDGENINRFMLENGYLAPEIFREAPSTSF